MYPATDSTLADAQQVIAVLRQQLASSNAQRDEALAQQAAAAEILRVISHSTFDLQAVLEALVETAAGLCNADMAFIHRRDGELYRLAASVGFPPEYEAHIRGRGIFRLHPRSVSGRAVYEKQIVHVHDAAAAPGYPVASSSLGKARTGLGVPLVRNGEALGVIALARQRVEPFTERQIELLKIFADQAVIAIENARLITETREALEQQTATAEVLQVINSSPGDIAPVFDAILEKAHSLCGATFGSLQTYDGEFFRSVAARGLPAAFVEMVRQPFRPDPDSFEERVVRGEDFVHVPDVRTLGPLPDNPISRAAVEMVGLRTVLLLPLRKETALVGYIAAARSVVQPFTDREIALLQNFAAQAVIAMENARLITKTRESLEQQTATAEVLGVINSSPGDLKPVFEAILERAHFLCGASAGGLIEIKENRYRAMAVHGEPGFTEYWLGSGWIEFTTDVPDRLRHGEIVHIEDYQSLRLKHRQPIIELSGARSLLIVPLIKDEVLFGGITAFRTELDPFTDRQIALLQNFAAQAVIAMENARLITETREALEQQTATAEVLEVINASPGNLAPVFDAMLEKTMRLCDAAFGTLAIFDGSTLRTATTRGVPREYARFRMDNPPVYGPKTAPGRFIAGERLIHNIDLKAEDAYLEGEPNRRALVDLGGARSALQVALRKDDALLGSMTIYRQEVRPFTEKQIALVQNFAAQAVIAMENARLITETHEALEQQTATAEVLQVINASPGDLRPVFDAMLEKAMRLCDAAFGHIRIYDGECFNLVAVRGEPRLVDMHRQIPAYRPGPHTPVARLMQGERIVHYPDAVLSEAYRLDPAFRSMIETGACRAMLAVVLRKDDALLGYINVYRPEARPFNQQEIALVETFAAQAVIAMENARLITETREALEQQTATAEVLGVINASPGDLAPVFDAMLEKATRLCEAAAGTFWIAEGQGYKAAAVRGMPKAFVDVARFYSPGPDTPVTRIADGEQVVHLHDVATDDVYRSGDTLIRAGVDVGIRTLLSVPLRKEGTPLGVFSIYRLEVRPFTDKQIALVQNFAAQAVIAIENARLITQTREALEQQTAAAEVLGVINASPGDLAPVFDAVLERATTLCEAAFGQLWTYDGERFHYVAGRGIPTVYADFLRDLEPWRPGVGTATLRVLHGEEFVHTVDLLEDEGTHRGDPVRRAIVEMCGARTQVAMPLRKDNVLLGIFMIYRQEVRPFTDKQISLLQNFAAQAVIAMENARLITETREALEQQTATAEVLGVINASPGDLNPVFEVMVARAAHLCEADEAAVRSFDGELLHLVTTHGTDPSALVRLRGLGPIELIGLYEPFARGAAVVHYVDARDTDAYRTYPAGRQRIDARGIRSWLAVALRKEGTLLGVINVHRRDVRPFTEKQIALLQNFAAQAVIAMENARLLDEIRQRQAELRVTIDNMGDGVVMFDAAHRLAAWNRNFQELLDLPDAALAERPSYTDYLRVLAARGEFGTDDVEAELAHRLRDTDQELRLERERPDGRVIEVRRNAVPDGGFVLIYSDITERKRSEAEIHAARDAAETAYHDLQAAQANLVQAQKMAALGQLTAGIAHEIKNPLNFVNNFASLSTELLDELKGEVGPALAALDGDKREGIDETIEMLTGNLDRIVEHGQRADNIVKSMLEHSRGVSGERREVDLNGLIEEALNLAYHGARAHDQNFNITLERDYAGNLKPMELAPQEMTRVFLNLFSNGFYAANKRAHANGDGAFRPVLAVATREDDNAVEVRVRDNGTGIPPEIKDKLFQPFFTTKPTGEGTGLGLSISYDIVTQQHGGTITVESEPGSFTEFTIRLPRQ